MLGKFPGGGKACPLQLASGACPGFFLPMSVVVPKSLPALVAEEAVSRDALQCRPPLTPKLSPCS